MGVVNKSFASTSIDSHKTQRSLEDLLTLRGIMASRWTHFNQQGDAPGKMRFEFEWKPIQEINKPRRTPMSFRLEVEYRSVEGPRGGEMGTTRDQAARALYWHVKNLFDAVDFGIVNIEQAFLPYLLMEGDVTAYERVADAMEQLQAGTMPLLTGGMGS